MDANAFYVGVPFRSEDKYYTTSLVFNEIKHIQKNYDILQTLLKIGRVIIIDAQQSYELQVIKMAKKTGNMQTLSKEDISIIALCLNLKGELITDDFTILNVAKNFGISTRSIMTSGIKNIKNFSYYCPGCNSLSIHNICNICGTKIKKKVIRSQSVFHTNQ